MRLRTYLQHGLIGATAVLLVGARLLDSDEPGPNVAAPATFVPRTIPSGADATRAADNAVLIKTKTAVDAFAAAVRPLSHRKSLETAFLSYFAFKAKHPEMVRKPYLYFVDYGLPSSRPRGYVLDMKTLRVLEGPFTVAHGRGSSESRTGIPTRFSNRAGSKATSLGLYVAQETYAFSGSAGGRRYRSLGLRLKGVSGEYNDNARARGIVAHGAPYVTTARAGRSEGCPAMEQARARRLLPKLAGGGMVFLFAPAKEWMSDEPWVVAASD